MKILMAASLLILASVGVALGQDPGWPRQITKQGSTLVYYQPQVDDWKGFTDLTWRMAFSLTPAGGRQVVGVVEMEGQSQRFQQSGGGGWGGGGGGGRRR